MPFRSYRFALPLCFIVAGCGAATDSAESERSSQLALSLTATDGGPALAYRYNAYVGEGPCSSVTTPTGTWTASPSFRGTDVFCGYQWKEDSAPAPSALLASLATNPETTTEIFADPACAPSSSSGSCGIRRLGTVNLPESADRSRYFCTSCIHAAVTNFATVDIVLPPELVTAAPSPVTLFLDGLTYVIQQPGGASKFEIMPIPPGGGRPFFSVAGIVVPPELAAAGGVPYDDGHGGKSHPCGTCAGL